ncbi:MAG TPA: peptidylprolyl isomerase [Candidatus Paceibacterota bacterium]
MTKIIIAAVGVLAVIFGGLFIYAQNTGNIREQTDTATSTDSLPGASAPQSGISVPLPTATTTDTATPTQGSSINNPNDKTIMSATLHTNMGDITIEFFPEQAPNTVANFIKLAEAGFYDGTKFHRVIKGFMDQGGDPLTKDDSKMALWGTGGPGYTFNDEVTVANANLAGTIAMANSGPNTQGSQFFINAVDNHSLDSGYTVFGKVTAGMDVVTAINNVPTDSSDRPLTPVVLQSVTLK